MQGKVCIITGSARGIGKAVALKFAEQGANIILIDINKEGIIKTAEEVKANGAIAIPMVVDITSGTGIVEAVAEIEDKFGKIDVLANCAGIVTSNLILDTEESEWDKVFNVNLKSIFLLSQAVAKSMIKTNVNNGRIVSISSQASKIGEYGNGSYSASKAGVNSLTQVLALELAEYGISVNAVCPGYVNTEMMQEVFNNRGSIENMTSEQYESTLVTEVPMKRMAEPEEIAELVLYLSSNKSNYITGTAITIAGGKTII